MGGVKKKEFLDPKGRLDHLVPRVHLRGFIHRDRDQKEGPLEVFDLGARAWVGPKSPDALCAEIGFYDYSVDVAEVTADEAFRDLESELDGVRKKLRQAHFSGWTKHRDFLVRFGVMLSARTRLFRERVIAQKLSQPALRVLDVKGTTIKVEPVDWSKEAGIEHLRKNLSITEMRRGMEEDPKEWARWNWSLLVAPSLECPFLTADHPGAMDVAYPDDIDRTWREGKFLILIPFGWDFAIAGGPLFPEPEGPLTLSVDQMQRLRRLMCTPEVKLLIGPTQLPDMQWVDEVLGPIAGER
jgi:hypothetical protein